MVMHEVVRYFTDQFATADKWAEKPAFGTPLEEHLKRSGREIALPIEACVMLLLETGMKEEVRGTSGARVHISVPFLCPAHPTCIAHTVALRSPVVFRLLSPRPAFH